MRKIKTILIGAGLRGMVYTNHMAKQPEKFEVVAVAEPIDSRRNYIKEKHGIPDDRCFTDWKPLLALGKIADVAIISTMDRDHLAPALEAINLKYDLLLEKPIAPLPDECKKLTEAAEKNNVKVVIGTVLRYTDIFNQLKDIIDSGKIGKVMSINHEECVGNVHQSHSFVRGNWGNSERSSTMLLQKSCHDMDILQWLIGKKCKKVQSFGTLSYFTKANAPAGSPEYCVEGCPAAATCPYNSTKVYLGEDTPAWFRASATRDVKPDDAKVMEAISGTQFGKCVYKCDNDVVDHQTVNLLFEDDITVTFTMNAFNQGGRHIHIMGTNGEIRASIDGESPVELYSFDTKEKEIIPLVGVDGMSGGHAGGDEGIVNALYEYLAGEYKGKSIPEIRESYYNHLIAFAAEKSRLENVIVDMSEYEKSII